MASSRSFRNRGSWGRAAGRVLLLSLSLAAVPAVAHAQATDDATRASARELGYAGIKDFEADNYAAASDKLEKAYRLLTVPSLGLWSARALVKRGLLVEGSERYREVGRLRPEGGDVAVQQAAQAEAANELNALTPRIPWITIDVQGVAPDSVTLTIDGVALPPQQAGAPRPVNPGQRKVRGVSGDERIEQTAVFAEGERKTVVLKFAPRADGGSPAPAAAPPAEGTLAIPPSQTSTSAPAESRASGGTGRVLGFVALGLGGAGLLVSGITGLVAVGKKGDIDESDSCDGLRCNPEEARWSTAITRCARPPRRASSSDWASPVWGRSWFCRAPRARRSRALRSRSVLVLRMSGGVSDGDFACAFAPACRFDRRRLFVTQSDHR